MARIRLEAAADLVRGFVREKEPVRAVVELIWNALDADAHNVIVDIVLTEGGAPDKITVTDDGHGMTRERIDAAFRKVGGSWKAAALFSEGEKRPMHGRLGRGRFRAFALGSEVRWTTVAATPGGSRQKTIISSKEASITDWRIEEELVEGDEPPMTIVEAWGKQSPNLPRLTTARATDEIAGAIAPMLLAHPDVQVVYDGESINPADNVDHDVTYDLAFEAYGTSYEAKLRVIEWQRGGDKRIYLCDTRNVPMDEVKSDVRAHDYLYSAYVLWDQMPDHRNEHFFEDGPLSSPVAELLRAARQRLRQHFDERRDEQSSRLIERWKQEHVYPYPTEPRTEVEATEQAIFNVVSTQIQRHIPQSRAGKGLTLSLLKGSLQHRPEEMTRVLSSVLNLTPEDRAELDRLLDRASLAGVIKTASSVANRLDFIAGLEQMVFDPVTSGLVGERAHLHKILEKELWIFGEQYNMMASERGLTEVLRRHLSLLGRDASNRISPVRPVDRKIRRIDLALTEQTPDDIEDQQVAAADVDHDRNRHLVVELKAPGVSAGKDEFDQVKNYARTVASDARFGTPPTEWDFWLVVRNVEEDVDEERRQRGKPVGLAYEPEPRKGVTVRIWVKEWGEIVEECKRRLQFYQKHLEHDPSVGQAIDYLRTKHHDLLPDQLRAKLGDQPGG